MIITRTPFRISFAGGGSDLAVYYRKFGGAVLSTSIDKYVYISAHPSFRREWLFLKYSQNETVSSVDEIKHPIIREVFRQYNISGVDLSSVADIPSGTGLASSSAFTVGLINLCNHMLANFISATEMASQACHIEIERLQEPIGKQDQYACACGGLNLISFESNEQVKVEKIPLQKSQYDYLENNLLLFYTGKTRAASDILKEQSQSLSDKKIENLHKMVKLAHELRFELLNDNIDAMGGILHAGWQYKKELSSKISEDFIDQYYELGIKNGAAGGKLLGAGGGGFLLFYAKEENHEKIRRAMQDLTEIPFKLDSTGSIVLYSEKGNCYV